MLNGFNDHQNNTDSIKFEIKHSLKTKIGVCRAHKHTIKSGHQSEFNLLKSIFFLNAKFNFFFEIKNLKYFHKKKKKLGNNRFFRTENKNKS